MKKRVSVFNTAWHRFAGDKIALTGVAGILLLLLPALYAPFIANGKPLFLIAADGGVSLPFIRSFFAPDGSEAMVEKVFNFASLFLPVMLIVRLICRNKMARNIITGAAALILLSAFITVRPVFDKQDYRQTTAGVRFVLFAAIPYGPEEIVSDHHALPDGEHIFGCDDVGRDLAARLIYGARVSLSVGIFATALSMTIGVSVGMSAGFFKGKFDLFTMRIVEILLCFPTFLLLLILMSLRSDLVAAAGKSIESGNGGANYRIVELLADCGMLESIPMVIIVIGLTGWMPLAFLVRGEVLKESSLPYIQSCIVSGIPCRRIMFKHLLPNISAPVLISFTFGIAGAIMSESALSFLGLGVQPPAASWGNLMRSVLDKPLSYWHLTFFPGMALFIAVLSFNFTGEGLRRAFDVKEN